MSDPILDLCVSIVVKAIDDYKYILTTGKEHKGSSVSELEQFFASEWCKSLLDFIDVPYTSFLKYLLQEKETICKV